MTDQPPIEIAAAGVSSGDLLAIFSSRRRQYRYVRVNRVSRTGDEVLIVPAEGGQMRLHAEQRIKIASRTGSR